MTRTARDIEAYLVKLDRRYEQIDDRTYAIDSGPNLPPIALRVDDPMIVVRVLIGSAPTGHPDVELQLYRTLLKLNANELLYSAYGLEDGNVVLSSALELENLDLNELESVLADMDLALARHVPKLRELSKV